MKVFSIDIETTGLEPTKHGIIEFAAVWGDIFNSSFPVKVFHSYLNSEDYRWTNYCLRLHKDWIFNRPTDVPTRSMPDLITDFCRWCRTECDVEIGQSINVIGKNFSTFDLPFLMANNWSPTIFKRRVIDIGPLYLAKGDKNVPDLQQCKKFAMIEGCPWIGNEVVMHNAVDDAMDVMRLAWWRFK